MDMTFNPLNELQKSTFCKIPAICKDFCQGKEVLGSKNGGSLGKHVMTTAVYTLRPHAIIALPLITKAIIVVDAN